MATIKLKQVVSKIDCNKKQKATLEALGFKKTNDIVEKENNECIQGMIRVVRHMVVEVK